MKEIPIEFMPGFWVSLSSGIEGKGSGFLLAENIKHVYSVGFSVPNSEDINRKWSTIVMTEDEINNNNNYLIALVKIISDSWIKTKSIIIIGTEIIIRKILFSFLSIIGKIDKNHINKIIYSKV